MRVETFMTAQRQPCARGCLYDHSCGCDPIDVRVDLVGEVGGDDDDTFVIELTLASIDGQFIRLGELSKQEQVLADERLWDAYSEAKELLLRSQSLEVACA